MTREEEEEEEEGLPQRDWHEIHNEDLLLSFIFLQFYYNAFAFFSFFAADGRAFL